MITWQETSAFKGFVKACLVLGPRLHLLGFAELGLLASIFQQGWECPRLKIEDSSRIHFTSSDPPLPTRKCRDFFQPNLMEIWVLDSILPFHFGVIFRLRPLVFRGRKFCFILGVDLYEPKE